MRPELSIVIPSHNRPDLLRACLASLARHAPRNTEILVIDDGSPGATVTRAAEAFPRVRILRLPRRQGFCAAVNLGLREAQGAIVELLNDDTEVTSGWAEPALAHFRDLTVGSVAPLVLRWTGVRSETLRIDSAGDCYFPGGFAVKRGHGQRIGPVHLQARPVFGASGSSAFYRRAAVLRVGAFPPSFGAYFEDVDLAFRLQRAGHRAVYEPGSRVLHRVSASHGRPVGKLLTQQSRNEERVFWRNTPARNLLWAVPLHLLVLIGKAWRRWRDGELAPFLSGRLRVLGEIPTLVRHRRLLGTILPADSRKSA